MRSENTAKVIPLRDPAVELAKLMAERERGLKIVASADAKLAELCRWWSFGNGYRMTLRPDQMKRALEAERDE